MEDFDGNGLFSARWETSFWTPGDYQLQKVSPCVDKGTNLPWTLLSGAVDLAGQGRVANGIVDMGANELWIPPPSGTAILVR